jgi:hypothetical protein
MESIKTFVSAFDAYLLKLAASQTDEQADEEFQNLKTARTALPDKELEFLLAVDRYMDDMTYENFTQVMLHRENLGNFDQLEASIEAAVIKNLGGMVTQHE